MGILCDIVSCEFVSVELRSFWNFGLQLYVWSLHWWSCVASRVICLKYG